MIAVLALNLAITIAALALVERQPRRPDRNGVGQFSDCTGDQQARFGDLPFVPTALQCRFHTELNTSRKG